MFPVATSKKFEFVGSIDSQMKTFTALRESNPERARSAFENGTKLVEHAQAGEFRKFRMIVDNGEEGDFLIYFVSQMMLSSLLGGHLMITQFIIDQGYPIHNYNIPNPLHQCLELTDDNNGAIVVEFLCAKKFDINRQQSQSWLTPLHIAIGRSLTKTVRVLIENGADVNAVAKDDLMPLHVAEKLENEVDRQRVVALLQEHGARDTWRNGSTTSTFTGVPTMETKHVSFGSVGGSVTMSGQHFAPASTNMVSMRGGGSGESNMVSMRGGGSGESNMVSIGGGKESESTAVPSNELHQCVIVDEKLRSDSIPEKFEDATFSYSTDGAMLFSTS